MIKLYQTNKRAEEKNLGAFLNWQTVYRSNGPPCAFRLRFDDGFGGVITVQIDGDELPELRDEFDYCF